MYIILYYCLLKCIYFVGLLATTLNDICGLSINLHNTSNELLSVVTVFRLFFLP